MSLDGLSGLVDSATTAVNSAGNAIGNIANSAVNMISSGPISGLGSIGSAVSSLFGGVGSFIQSLSGVQLPLKNPLFSYASYTYVLGLGCLSDYELNNPDTTYQTGAISNLIAKSANIDPNNRVNTVYGKADFFLDNVVMRSQIGFDGVLGNTNVQNFTFEVTEPYSMGMFIIACQQLAQSLGHNNWREAPFILTVDFRGNKETGQMDLIKGCSRRIPFSFTNMTMKVTEKGAVYHCEAMAWVQAALTDEKSLFKSDAAARGTTVQEILQTGENSLEVMLNRRAQELVKSGAVAVADEYVILFPIDPSSSSTGLGGLSESNAGATTSSQGNPAVDAIYQTLGVSRSSQTGFAVQTGDSCNAIGMATLGFDETRRGDSSPAKEGDVYDKKTNTFQMNSIKINPKETEMRFGQDTAIPAAINQVLIQSDYAKEALDPANLSPEGYRGWWRIDCQVYNISTDANMDKTGTKPKVIVYRVVPYNVHSSRMTAPNAKAPGFENLKLQACKQYDYIYTGKNVDVIKFEIDVQNGFSTIMGADALERTQDKVTGGSTSSAEGEDQADVKAMPVGNQPSTKPGASPSIVKFINTLTKSDRGGGGGSETQATRAARLFQDAVSTMTDLYNLDITIIGDPYYIMQSGAGNYTSQQSQFANLNVDGSMNHQNGEVDIQVNFRTPIDINQTTGLYSFSQAGSKTAPVLAYSGLYCVQEVTSVFKSGQFTQNLKGFRRPLQEVEWSADPSKLFSPSNTNDKKDPQSQEP